MIALEADAAVDRDQHALPPRNAQRIRRIDHSECVLWQCLAALFADNWLQWLLLPILRLAGLLFLLRRFSGTPLGPRI